MGAHIARSSCSHASSTAARSAFKDRRFSPITESELQRLECG